LALCTNCGTDNPERAKFCLECGATLAQASEASRGARKLVTVLFADVVGSTALGEQLDPETMRSALGRYFSAARTILERHGGTVEKFIGDAVMAVFGIPLMHEDDALRAVRAALELRSEIGRLNDVLTAERHLRVEFRIGVNSGTVVAGGTEGSGSFVTGDAVNVAARLEQAAGAGEILIGDATYRLVRDFVEAEPSAPIAVKGKTGEMSAHRVLGLTGVAGTGMAVRQLPFVGRRRELIRLREAFDDASADRRCMLFTLLGSAGVGKSRLVVEFLAELSGNARILRGRCLPYGEGITYWPVAEIIRAASGGTEEDDAVAIKAHLVERLAGDSNAERVAELLTSILGLSVANAPPEERFWAVRRFLEAQAREQPLICIVEDIHWAEPAMLDLLENVADLSRDAPILLLCTARPELLEARATWGGGKVNATTILLEPLNAELTRELVAGLVGDAGLEPHVVERILATAEGNPLFAEEIVRMLTDDGPGRADGEPVQIPTSVQAVIAARLDRLPAYERGIAERAAVAGRVFERSAVLELVRDDERERVPAALLALMRKELVQPSPADLTADEAFRFRHMLIRDTAYGALPKQDRAELHERFARWVERMAADRLAEYAEILAYHFDLAQRYRRELGLDDAHSAELSERAGELLREAAHRAYLRGESASSMKLAQRAADLLPDGTGQCQALITLTLAADFAYDFDVAGVAMDRLLSAALASGDEAATWKARLFDVWRQMWGNPKFRVETASPAVSAAIAAFERLGDEHGLAIAHRTLAEVYLGLAQWEQSKAAAERGLPHALLSGDVPIEGLLRNRTLGGALWGPTPVAELLQIADRTIAEITSAASRASSLGMRGMAHAMAGHAAAARADVEESLRVKSELGDPGYQWSFTSTPVEMVLGDLDAADFRATSTIAVLEKLGETGARSTVLGFRARIAFEQGRPDDEVAGYANACRELASDDDIVSQTQWRAALALVAARAGRIDEAKRLIEEASTVIGTSDFLYELGLTAQDRGYIHERAGEIEAARREYGAALRHFEAKGDVMDAGRVRERLAALGQSGS
jgi:class 3 adenylate cyclase/tetratricopeptide (TPR) repeat protein